MFKPTQRHQTDPPLPQNFSFAHPRIQSANDHYLQLTPTPQERKIFAMWLSNTLQPHTEEFIQSLDGLKPVQCLQMNRWMEKEYPHWEKAVRFYVLAAMMDYGKMERSGEKPDCNRGMKVVVEELAGRFFRESQWMEQLQLPVYLLFPLIDPFLQGYTSLPVLKAFVQHEVPLHPQQHSNQAAFNLLARKLSPHSQGKQVKLTQQDVCELMLRSNSSAFVMRQQRQTAQSQAYRYIKDLLAQQEQKEQDQVKIRRYENMERSRQQLNQLSLARQDAQIQLMSAQKMKQPQQNYVQSSQTPLRERYHLNIPPRQQQNEKIQNQTVNKPNESSIKVLKQTRANYNNNKNDENQGLISTNISRQLPKYTPQSTYLYPSPFKTPLQHNLYPSPSLQLPNPHLPALRSTILTELQILRNQRYQTHRKLLRYV